jgi:hypothetical protein
VIDRLLALFNHVVEHQYPKGQGQGNRCHLDRLFGEFLRFIPQVVGFVIAIPASRWSHSSA